MPSNAPTRKFDADELPESRLELIVGRTSCKRPRSDHRAGVTSDREAPQEIREPLVVLRPPNHFHSIEITEPAHEIGQEAPQVLLVSVLRPVAGNATSARRSRWATSNGSDTAVPGRDVAFDTLQGRLTAPAGDDRAIGTYPDETDTIGIGRWLLLWVVGN